ncbi:DUF5319 domain-containing protein [Corynebacterium sp. TAE3-ERU12]|nr:DUF5319 domain-containing protein [Corynebacterium sp. TAE3-ERU12]MBV7294729.1 DUF5319 domain-containing protein [Corynebacterium sp. TAE3-ERU12]
MPRDPFEDDPNDPSRLLEPEEHFEPLTEQEREEVRTDLACVREFRAAMSPVGFLGVCMVCEDCQQMHFYTWEMLENHYLLLLAGKQSPVHEPEFDPDVTRYAPWDYCLGYTDARMRRRP